MLVNRAVFLDRDGTINIDKGYVHKVEDFEFIPGALEAMRRLQKAGYRLIVITNQSGIARGLYSFDDYECLTAYMKEELKKASVFIDDVYCCPHHPDFDYVCDCRKPSTGLFLRAQKEHSLEIGECWAVGDNVRDLQICAESKCWGVLLGSTLTGELKETGRVYNAADLIGASEIILQGEMYK